MSFQATLLMMDHRIQGVLVFGAGRLMNGVLLVPAPDYSSTSSFISDIQPTIDHLNTIVPKYARLQPGMVLVVSPDKPLPFSDKGTLQRRRALALYENEINEAYEIMDRVSSGDVINRDLSLEEVTAIIRGFLPKIHEKHLEDDDDFFEHG